MELILKHKKTVIISGIIIITVLMILLLSNIANSSNQSSELTGKVEAKEVDVSTKIAGRVQEITVTEGQQVKAGDTLVKIDQTDLNILKAQAEAGVKAAEGDLAKARSAARLIGGTSQGSLEKARAGADKAQADEELAKKTYDRMQELLKAGAISQQDFEKIENTYKTAVAGNEAAQGDLKAAQAGLLQVNVYQADVQRAEAALDKAKADLEKVRVNLEECLLKAPCNGTVTALNIEKQELAATGITLVTITDYTDNWVNLKVSQNALREIAVGQELQVYQAGSPEVKIDGKIEDISNKAEFAAARATNDRGEKDIITYNVKIRTNSSELRPGMNVCVSLSQDGGR